MQFVLTMFYTLQIIVYLQIYDTKIPSNAEIYVEEIIKLVEFDVLKPDSIGKVLRGDPDFKFLNYLKGTSSFED
jgi:hypothetical protein